MTLSLFNAHTHATALSVVWDPTDQQLVAAVLSAVDKAVLTALKAELEKNGAGRLTLRVGEQTVSLAGARRGFARANVAHDKFHSYGSTLALQHWKALDPREGSPGLKSKPQWSATRCASIWPTRAIPASQLRNSYGGYYHEQFNWV